MKTQVTLRSQNRFIELDSAHAPGGVQLAGKMRMPPNHVLTQQMPVGPLLQRTSCKRETCSHLKEMELPLLHYCDRGKLSLTSATHQGLKQTSPRQQESMLRKCSYRKTGQLLIHYRGVARQEGTGFARKG